MRIEFGEALAADYSLDRQKVVVQRRVRTMEAMQIESFACTTVA